MGASLQVNGQATPQAAAGEAAQDATVFDHIVAFKLNEAVAAAIGAYQRCNGTITKSVLEDLHFLSFFDFSSI